MSNNAFNDQHLLVLIGVHEKKSFRAISETIIKPGGRHVSLGWVQQLVRQLKDMGHIRKIEVAHRNIPSLKLTPSGEKILRKEGFIKEEE